MAAVTSIIAATGLALSAASTIGGVVSARKAAKADEKAEGARQQAMNLDAQRRKRAVVREMQMQQSLALSNATVQGAAQGSGVQGAMAGAQAQGMTNITGITQQQALGNQVFAANRQSTRARSSAATWEGVGTLGGAMVRNAGTINSIGQWAFA